MATQRRFYYSFATAEHLQNRVRFQFGSFSPFSLLFLIGLNLPLGHVPATAPSRSSANLLRPQRRDSHTSTSLRFHYTHKMINWQCWFFLVWLGCIKCLNLESWADPPVHLVIRMAMASEEWRTVFSWNTHAYYLRGRKVGRQWRLRHTFVTSSVSCFPAYSN